MAAKKAVCTLFLLDVGKDAQSLEAIERTLSSHVLTRLLYKAADQFSIILYGSDETHNPVNSEMSERGEEGEYMHISVAQVSCCCMHACIRLLNANLHMHGLN